MPHLAPMNWIMFMLLTWFIMALFMVNTWWLSKNHKTLMLYKSPSLNNYWKW
uniref:ATP synthase F0 subunit 8 n=1 Tax=Haementeria officinalis TaxID=6410 RepID=A0A175D090_HAEOF|nr:ATP synthase F0 subunit 8 [Haementeria officinalis]